MISESLESSFVRESCFSAVEKTALERWAKVAPDSVGRTKTDSVRGFFGYEYADGLNIAHFTFPPPGQCCAGHTVSSGL